MLTEVIRKASMLVAVVGLAAYAVLEYVPQAGESGNGSSVRATPDASPLRAATRTASEPSGQNTLSIRPGAGGHYFVEATVNGREIPFLVDTGATMVALSRADARRAGLTVDQLEFSGRVNTANGVARVAPVVLDEIAVGGLVVRRVPAAVIDSRMETSLLGMSFLKRLAGFEVADGVLVLRW